MHTNLSIDWSVIFSRVERPARPILRGLHALLEPHRRRVATNSVANQVFRVAANIYVKTLRA